LFVVLDESASRPGAFGTDRSHGLLLF